MSIGRHVKKSVSLLFPGAAIIEGKRHSTRSVAITFDDGPDSRHTARILDILSNVEARATFFLVGSKALNHPSLVRAIHACGHQVANHSFSHLNARLHPINEIIEDAKQGQAALEDILGVALKRDFRPPYGAVTPRSFIAIARLGFRFVYWSIDSMDHATESSDQTFANVAGRSRSGDIVLFHEDYAHTTLALPLILDEIRGRGLSFDTVDALSPGPASDKFS